MSKVKKLSVVPFVVGNYCININCGNICNSCKGSEEDKLKSEAKAVTEDIVKNIPDITIGNCKKVEGLGIDNNINVVDSTDDTGAKFGYNDVIDITGALENFKGAIKAAIQKDNFDKIGKYINGSEIFKSLSTKINKGLDGIFGFNVKANISHLRLRIIFNIPKDIKFNDIFGFDFPSTIEWFKNVKYPSYKFIKDFIIAIIDNLGFEVYFDDKDCTKGQSSRLKDEKLIFKYEDIKNINSGSSNVVFINIISLFDGFRFIKNKAVTDIFTQISHDLVDAGFDSKTKTFKKQEKINELIQKIPAFASALNKVPIFSRGLKLIINLNIANPLESGVYYDQSSVTTPTL